MRQPAGDHRIGEPPPRRHPQPLVVEEGALAALGGEQVVVGGIVDQPGDHGAFALERDRDGEVRDAVQEVRGAVERIDDPGVGLVGALAAAAFLAEEAVARARGASVPRAGSLRRVRSAAVTKLAGPLSDTCRFSTSPKSRLSVRAALRAALIMTLRRAERSMARSGLPAAQAACVKTAVSRASLDRSSEGCAAFSAAAMVSGFCLRMKASSFEVGARRRPWRSGAT